MWFSIVYSLFFVSLLYFPSGFLCCETNGPFHQSRLSPHPGVDLLDINYIFKFPAGSSSLINYWNSCGKNVLSRPVRNKFVFLSLLRDYFLVEILKTAVSESLFRTAWAYLIARAVGIDDEENSKISISYLSRLGNKPQEWHLIDHHALKSTN